MSLQVKNEFLPEDASFSIQNGSFDAISLLFSLNVTQNNVNNVFWVQNAWWNCSGFDDLINFGVLVI